jgi:hypothetical protein
LVPQLNTEQQVREQLLSFTDNSLGRKLLQTLHNLVNIGVLMFITWLLLQIFKSLAQDNPFGAGNAQRIRWMGFAVLFLVFFDAVEAFMSRFYTAATVTISGAQLHRYNYSFDLETFLLGLLLLILAEVFRRGAEYQADSESIL